MMEIISQLKKEIEESKLSQLQKSYAIMVPMVITNLITSYGDLFESWYAAMPKPDYSSPGSTRFHHDYKWGMMVHIGQMVRTYLDVATKHKMLPNCDNPDFTILAILLHDHFKMVDGHYIIDEKTGNIRSSEVPRNHLRECYEYIKLNPCQAFTDDESEELLHMIASHHGRMEWGCVEEPKTPAAKLLHQLDMISAHCMED